MAKEKSETLFNIFDLDRNSLRNYMIPLEKLLKVLLAFDKNGYHAFSKGSSVLKPNSIYYKDFSLNIDQLFTIDNMIKLYLPRQILIRKIVMIIVLPFPIMF